eukprot:1691281-Pyramimonas_sp.AAC.1
MVQRLSDNLNVGGIKSVVGLRLASCSVATCDPPPRPPRVQQGVWGFTSSGSSRAQGPPTS